MFQIRPHFYETKDRRLDVIESVALSENEGCSSNYIQNTGDAAQTATTWKMRSKIKSTITTPFSQYVLVLFAHSCDLTLMVQHNESRGDKC